jgi:hypothetical protein
VRRNLATIVAALIAGGLAGGLIGLLDNRAAAVGAAPSGTSTAPAPGDLRTGDLRPRCTGRRRQHRYPDPDDPCHVLGAGREGHVDGAGLRLRRRQAGPHRHERPRRPGLDQNSRRLLERRKPISSSSQLTEANAPHEPGGRLRLEVVRNGVTRSVGVALGTVAGAGT